MKLSVSALPRSYALVACAVVLAVAAIDRFVEESASPATARAAERKPAIDPLQANGPIFVDWPKPQFAIVFSGELDGYIEPCGCAGLENQLGGLKRRHSFLKQRAAEGWPLVELDLGGLVKRADAQSQIKYRYALQSLAQLGYQAVGLGPNDVRLGVDSLAFALGNFAAGKCPIVSANVGIYGLKESVDLGMTRRYRVIEAGGKRIGVTAVLGARNATTAANVQDLAYVPPAQALADVGPQLAGEKCDVQVLLVHGDAKEAAELSQKFPQFQIVACAGADEPPKQPATIPGSQAVLIEAGHKGMYVTVLGFFDSADPQKRTRYQRVPLDSRFSESIEMKDQLANYQKELETMTLAGLQLTGVAHPDGEFVGSETCGGCHPKAWAKLQQTPHFHATDTLMKLDPPRHFDPECLSCHVTGWNAQEYFPYTTGYVSLEATPQMKQNGCENCHGPGSDHVKAESGEVEVTEAQRDALRAAMRRKIVTNEGNKEGQTYGDVVKKCMECHDLDNSPDFDFQKYWPEIAHPGVD